MKHSSILRGACAVALALSLGACSSTKESRASNLSDTEWVRASPVLQQQLEDAAEQLPWAKGLQRLELIRFFATVGEPAYDLLLELAMDPRTTVASSAYSALGATGDSRLVDRIHELEWNPSERTSDLVLERARTLARLGDWSTLPTLIRGLEDERLYTRALSYQALQEITRERIEYDPRSAPEDRQLAIAAWERWWLKYSGQPMPPRSEGDEAPTSAPTAVLED